MNVYQTVYVHVLRLVYMHVFTIIKDLPYMCKNVGIRKYQIQIQYACININEKYKFIL